MNTKLLNIAESLGFSMGTVSTLINEDPLDCDEVECVVKSFWNALNYDQGNKTPQEFHEQGDELIAEYEEEQDEHKG